MAETMLLALERPYADASLGANLNLQQNHELDALAGKHGFSVECEWEKANSRDTGAVTSFAGRTSEVRVS